MKKLIIIPLICVIFGCTATKPTTTAPVINQTITVNQTTITGDNNTSGTETVAKNDQTSEPTVKTETVKKDQMWIFWTILLACALLGAWYLSKKTELF